MKNFYSLLPILIILLVPSITLSQTKDDGFKWSELPLEIQGFVNTRHATRIQGDSLQSKDYILGESRFQLEANYWFDKAEINAKTDFVYDSWSKEVRVDVREANIFFTPISWFDLKIGRQILTWGKGDMLFVNDLFPKNWKSFFTGRDLAYLKSTSDAAKLTFHLPWFELNAIYVPKFNNDVFPDGQRLSFYDPFNASFRGDGGEFLLDQRDDWFDETEFHWRIRRNIKGFDLAFYGYYGYWKSPAGFNTKTGQFTFPKLYEHGLSLEGSFVRGITSLELGYFYSADDKDGTDFAIRNSTFILLLGHALDFKNDFKVSLQYYAEVMLDYQSMKDNFPSGFAIPNQVRDNVTLRLSKMVNKQKIDLSLFTYYSIVDNDFYIRPNISYKFKDGWKAEVGANLFGGKETRTFWSQFQMNNNLYAGIQWNF